MHAFALALQVGTDPTIHADVIAEVAAVKGCEGCGEVDEGRWLAAGRAPARHGRAPARHVLNENFHKPSILPFRDR